MPFTFAHPAIILPLIKKSSKFSITALIIGSIIPDFEFFLQLREVENIGHHWYGILLFDFPIGLFFCYLFHTMLRNALIVNIPQKYQKHWISYLSFNWTTYAAKNKLVIVYSLFIGIISHILLDGFTHEDGFFVEMLPFLKANLLIIGFTFSAYYFLQIIFSAIGLLIVLNYLYKASKNIQSKTAYFPNKLYWLILICTALSIIFVRVIIWPQYNTFWGVFMACMGGVIYSWVFTSIFYFKKPYKKTSMTTNIKNDSNKQNQKLVIDNLSSLTGLQASEIRSVIEKRETNEYKSVYINAKDVNEISLSGINEIIHTNYILQNMSVNLIFVYRKNSVVSKWVENTGLSRFITTALVP